jgi:hypothetical protein
MTSDPTEDTTTFADLELRPELLVLRSLNPV